MRSSSIERYRRPAPITIGGVTADCVSHSRSISPAGQHHLHILNKTFVRRVTKTCASIIRYAKHQVSNDDNQCNLMNPRIALLLMRCNRECCEYITLTMQIYIIYMYTIYCRIVVKFCN